MDQKGEAYSKADIAASFQHEAVSFLADNTFEAAAREGIDKIGIAGGVSANGALSRITSYNVCYTKLLRQTPLLKRHWQTRLLQC